jgi:serine protease Do
VLGAAIATSSVLWVSVLRESHASGTMRPASAADRASTASPDSGRKFGDEARIVAAVKRVAPSVVALSVIVGGRRIIPANPFYRGGVNAEAEKTVPFQARSSGSGFVFTKAGLIVTTAHVVQPVQGAAVRIAVVFHNGDRVPAQLYAVDSVADIALIQVSHYATLPPPLEMGTSSSVRAGQWAIAIGAPYELEQSVTLGVISGFNRTESVSAGSQTRTFKGLLQTSAPINPGNSGGPLIDYFGKVVGINQMVASPQAGAQGIGFAIPVDTVKQQVAVLEQRAAQPALPAEAFLGVALLTIDDNVRAQLSYAGGGVAVESVFAGGPADRAGLEPGDVIVQTDGTRVATAAQLQTIVRAAKPGQLLHLDVWSSGRMKAVIVTLGSTPINR